MTRLETFAAAAMSGLVTGLLPDEVDPDETARAAVAVAKALAEAIDRQFTVDADDPDFAEVPDA